MQPLFGPIILYIFNFQIKGQCNSSQYSTELTCNTQQSCSNMVCSIAFISELCWNQPPLAVIGEEIHNYTQFLPTPQESSWFTYGDKTYAYLNDLFPDGQPLDTMNVMLSVLEYAGIQCTVHPDGTLSSCVSGYISQ